MVETNSLAREFMLNFTESLMLETYEKLHDVWNKKSFDLDMATLRRRGKSEGEGFFCVTLPSLMIEFLSYLENGTFVLHSFRRYKRTVYPTFLNGLFSLASHNSDISVVAFKCLYQILYSFKKLRGDYEEDILQNYEDAFVETDDWDNDHTNEYDDIIVSWASVFCEQIFHQVENDEDEFNKRFAPRPGPGSTNTFLPHTSRWRINEIYEGLEDLSLDYMYVNYTYMHDDLNVRSQLCDGKIHKPPTSRFKFVPKTRAKPRGICIEENEMQFLQQGLKSLMYDVIENRHLTKGKINFSDQRINGRLALASSCDKEMATIDMSEASDRVYRKLVFRVFNDCPRIKMWLEKLSTRTIELPSGKLLMCKKFSPMGSGICFPVMSVVHWTLIRAILFLSQHDDSKMDEVYVYGDDIVLPSDTFDTIVGVMPRFGMKINRSKSYCNSSFRESCGVHAYKGVDVTPVFIKIIPEVNLEPVDMLSTLAVEYQLFSAGWHKTCLVIREKCDVKRYALSKSPAIAWKRDNITDLPLENLEGVKVRWCNCFQRFEVRVKTVVEVSDKDSRLLGYTESSAYLRSLLTLAKQHDDQWARSVPKYRWCWIPMRDVYDEDSYTRYLRFQVLGINVDLFHRHRRLRCRHANMRGV